MSLSFCVCLCAVFWMSVRSCSSPLKVHVCGLVFLCLCCVWMSVPAIAEMMAIDSSELFWFKRNKI